MSTSDFTGDKDNHKTSDISLILLFFSFYPIHPDIPRYTPFYLKRYFTKISIKYCFVDK